jgi:hypothetical protein
MTDKKFAWNEEKHKLNKIKHKISFEEASSVFDYDFAIYFNDETHSQDEDIDLSDISEITDFSKGIRNPFAGMFKDGYTIIVEHADFDEEITVQKTRREKQCS